MTDGIGRKQRVTNKGYIKPHFKQTVKGKKHFEAV